MTGLARTLMGLGTRDNGSPSRPKPSPEEVRLEMAGTMRLTAGIVIGFLAAYVFRWVASNVTSTIGQLAVIVAFALAAVLTAVLITDHFWPMFTRNWYERRP